MSLLQIGRSYSSHKIRLVNFMQYIETLNVPIFLYKKSIRKLFLFDIQVTHILVK